MTCPPDISTPLSCRLDEIVHVLSNQSVPITDWILVWVTLAGVLASTFVGIMAALTSARALRIAKDAARAEERRDDDHYRDTLNDALARFILAISDHQEAIETWRHEADRIETPLLNLAVDPDEIPYPARPQMTKIAGTLAAARLVARGDDKGILEQVHSYVDTVRARPLLRQSIPLASLTSLVRRWRDETLTIDEVKLNLSLPTSTS